MSAFETTSAPIRFKNPNLYYQLQSFAPRNRHHSSLHLGGYGTQNIGIQTTAQTFYPS